MTKVLAIVCRLLRLAGFEVMAARVAYYALDRATARAWKKLGYDRLPDS